jgi:single-strand DNA-binding protein
MARGLNRVTIIGCVEREQEMRYTPSGQAVTSFPVSTTHSSTTASGQPQTVTDWFNLVAWGHLAEVANQSLRLKQQVYAEGYLQTRQWLDQGGQRHFRTEIVASRLIPLGDELRDTDQELGQDGSGMTPCLNRVMIIGNLGRDPEMRYTSHGQAVTSFSVATSHPWITAEGERRTATEWVDVISWGHLAEICSRYLCRGRRVYVEGELCTRRWRYADGQERIGIELVANEMILLGPRPTGDGQRQAVTHAYADDRSF